MPRGFTGRGGTFPARRPARRGGKRRRHRGSSPATGLRTPTTSGSSHKPGTIPWLRMESSTSVMPFGKRLVDGLHVPKVSHQVCPSSAHHPESMERYSAPTRAAAATRGSSRSVFGSPIKVFMKSSNTTGRRRWSSWGRRLALRYSVSRARAPSRPAVLSAMATGTVSKNSPGSKIRRQWCTASVGPSRGTCAASSQLSAVRPRGSAVAVGVLVNLPVPAPLCSI